MMHTLRAGRSLESVYLILAALAGSLVLATRSAEAQIRVNPTGVSTNSMNPTTVFLTFGGLRNQVAVEGVWCGEVLPAIAPDRGTRCDPGTVYGRLPLRSNLAQQSRNGALTDIMSIPASVARRAYLAAFRGQSATFFYVRRFTSTSGGADEYVVVTCRLTGGGAGVPFALTNVQIAFETQSLVQLVRPEDVPPAFSATIAYNGSGQLRGRWEVVMPGEELPTSDDLLTESTLPPEERGGQRRYALLDRFNIMVPPNGKVVVPGPDPTRLPRAVEGTYLVLLRIESSDDKAGDSDLGAIGAGGVVLHNGAVAGFPMPTLRYVVGAASDVAERSSDAGTLLLLTPRANAQLVRNTPLLAQWTKVWGATYYRVEFETLDGRSLVSAVVRKGTTTYEVPPTMAERATGTTIRWRVVALDGRAGVLRRSAWRRLSVAGPEQGATPKGLL